MQQRMQQKREQEKRLEKLQRQHKMQQKKLKQITSPATVTTSSANNAISFPLNLPSLAKKTSKEYNEKVAKEAVDRVKKEVTEKVTQKDADNMFSGWLYKDIHLIHPYLMCDFICHVIVFCQLLKFNFSNIHILNYWHGILLNAWYNTRLCGEISILSCGF